MTPNQWMFRKGWEAGDALLENEIPADPALPQLAMMLNRQVMGGILQDSMSSGNVEGRLQIEQCRIAGLGYRPGRECRVNYALETYDNHNGQQTTALVCAKIMTKKMTEQLLAKRMQIARDRGVSFTYLPDHQMILTTFPNDLRVRKVHRMFNAKKFERVVRTALREPTARLERSDDGLPRLAIVSYRPERSCLVRCFVRRADDGSRQPVEMLARVYRHKRAVHIHRVMSALWEGNARLTGVLGVAEPLGCDARARVLFQARVNGSPLGDQTTCGDFFDNVALSAQNLASIHLNPFSVERTRTVDDELRWIEMIAQGLAPVLPEAGERLNHILRQLRCSKQRVLKQSQSLIHGDFSLNQVLADAGRVNVIDFDDACMGDRYADVGSFLARLEGRVQKTTSRHRAKKVFLQQYETTYKTPLIEDRVDWHQAVAFVRLAFSTIAHLRPGWHAKMDKYFSQAEALLLGPANS